MSERLPPVGIGDLVDVVRVLDLHGEQLAAAAELLQLRPRPEAPVQAPAERPVAAVPRRSPESAAARAGAGATPASELPPSLPLTVVERPAEPIASTLAARPLSVLLPERAVVPPPLESLFAPGTRRALLRGVTATRERDGDVDIDAVIDQLATTRTLDEVPLEWIETTRGEVTLLLDMGVAMDPFRADVDRLPDELARVVGDDGLKLRWFEDCPDEVLSPGAFEPQPFRVPAAHTRLLAVTTFGVRGTLGAPPGVLAGWRRLVRACRRTRVPLLVLTPLPPRRRPVGVAAVTWDRTTGIRDVRRALPR